MPTAEEKKAEKKRKEEEKKAAKAKAAEAKRLKKEAAAAEKKAKKEAKIAKKKGLPPPAATPVSPTANPPSEPVKEETPAEPTPEPAAEPAAAPEPTPAEPPAPEPAKEEPAETKPAEEVKPEEVKPDEAKPVEATPEVAVEPPAPATEAPAPAEEAKPAEASQKAEPVADAVSVPPPESLATSASATSLMRSDGGPRRRSSGRRSIHGAPACFTSPGDKYEPQAEEDEIAPEMIEDDWDEQVGDMVDTDATQNASYLANAIDQLRERMKVLYDGGTNRGYSKAYQSLAMVGRGQPATASALEGNKLKNRYGNISAYDHSRVVLPVINDDPNTDYVNANWIDGYKKSRHYVASQGPVPNSFISFWRCVWFMKAEVIVMVTHEVEKGRMKCHRYWPDPTSSPPVTTQQYGNIVVRHVSSVPHKHFIVRSFVVSQDGEERNLKQFAYTSWPDHGVPLTTAEMLGFRNAINHSVTDPEVPILIHCSAGVGRTGTYIAIDRLVRQALDRGGDLDVDSIITDMREARNYMVQTEVQYMFIYRAVLDCLTELLADESKKVEATSEDDKALQSAAQAAAQAQEEEQRREQAEIEKARLEVLAGASYSAENASQVIKVSIKQRMQALRSAQDQWIEKYKKSLEEWSERNKFEAEEYDLTSSLTPMQSRLEALRQKGIVG